MIEQEQADALCYADLIEEVFIAPIRTVVVVDDEFPTLQTLLTKQDAVELTATEKTAALKVLEIIRFCKESERRWMLEVHDSSPNSDGAENNTSNVHQSDLMILDFHLDKARPDEGTEAIRILRNLALSDHFNLVVVYTKGYDTPGGDIARVAREIAIGLSSSDSRLMLEPRAVAALQANIDDWSDEDGNIRRKIAETVDDGVYARVQTISTGNEINWDEICSLSELQQLRALHEGVPQSIKRELTFKKLVKWALHSHQVSLQQRLSNVDLGQVSFNLNNSDMVNWIRTDSLFVTVVSKAHEPATLPLKLLDSLKFWNPEPHRLLMSKMRATLDKIGVLAEDEVLSNRHLQAGWLNEYLIQESAERHSKVHSTISKHWEGLGDAVRIKVIDFAKKLADLVAAEGREPAMEKWYKAVTDEDVHSHLNRYACSKPIEGIHLTTGHVIQLPGAGNAKGQYWLCLSPACDLVPGQKNTGWPGRLGQHIPFIAVELFEVAKAMALENAFGSNFLFLTIAGELKFFSFTPMAKKEAQDLRTPSPKWEQMFAGSQGVFRKEDNHRKLAIMRTSEHNGQLQMTPSTAIVVAQLRYEYALNLLQRIGTNLSRIGLDFVELSCK